MLTAILSFIPATISVVLLALIVLLRRGAASNVLYFILSLIIAIFITSQFIASVSGGETALFFVRLGSMLTNFMALVMILFAAQFTGLKLSRVVKFTIALPPLVFSLISYTDLIIQSVTQNNYSFSTEVGALYNLQTLFLVSYFSAAIAILVSAYKRSVGDQREVLRLMIVGFSVPIVVNFITNFIFIGNASVQFLAPLSLLFLSGTIFYAIVRHGLFEIRPLIVRSLAYILSLGLVGLIFTVLSFTLTSFVVNSEVTRQQQAIYALLSVLLAILFQPLKIFFDKATNRIFYKDAYSPQMFLNELNASLVNSSQLQEILSLSSGTIAKYLKPSYCDIIIFSADKAIYLSTIEEPQTMKLDFITDFIERSESSQTKSILTDDLDREDQIFKKKLITYKVALLVKLPLENGLSGVIILGDRKSGNRYSSKDVQLVETAGDAIAIASQNSLRYEEIKSFNATLQTKISEAIKKLQRTNEKLTELDEAKDEFISMASHQLRTPLTSVKGYISMILEGDAGDINDLQKKFLNQAFISSQRMVYLISDLLNVSRLKTGKFVIENSETYLPDTVEQELKQLDETVKARGLKLEYKKPKNFPTVMLDEEKIRQVIMNFADNAIYYTPSGGKIVVELKATNSTIEYAVKDSGIGVPRHEQHHLFTKFYRAVNARKARPDGTGLGLFMAKKVITAQGGAIIFNSTEGKGSTFGFTFPRQKIEQKN